MAEYESGDERVEELDTLQSIYPELTIDLSNPAVPVAHLDLDVVPIEPLSVTFDSDVLKISHLPPLIIDIILSSGYPTEHPPRIKILTNPAWLPEDVLRRLENHAVSLWEEYGGMQMLFAYISYLQEASETSFDIRNLNLPDSMKPRIAEFNETTARDMFDHETFDCGVCLEPKKGSACYRMKRCQHVFCKACLQDYYNNCIKEGDVNSVKCLAPDCGKTGNARADRGKKDRLISPKELLQIPLPLPTVQRYAELKRKKRMESDPSIVFCPRSWCQGPMRSNKYPRITDVSQMDESDSESEEIAKPATDEEGGDERQAHATPASSDRLVICEKCSLAFCRNCLASWHGDFFRCISRSPEELNEDDQASLNFILHNTSPCPTCSVPCQKSHGCNHMTCFQCKTHFCYLCSAWLTPDDPYRHFNDKRNKACFNRLMDLSLGDNADGEVRFGGRRGAAEQAEFWEREALRIQMEEMGFDS